jgi:hypothetical protein
MIDAEDIDRVDTRNSSSFARGTRNVMNATREMGLASYKYSFLLSGNSVPLINAARIRFPGANVRSNT